MPDLVRLDWERQYRIIPSKFPSINFFEDLANPALMDELAYIEGLTNDRLRDEIGEIALVAKDDRVSGPGSSPVMASFTHIERSSRFTDGTFGIYYAANSLKTAISETSHHRSIFLSATNEDACEIDMRVYVGEVAKEMHDIRDITVYGDFHDPEDYSKPQAFGLEMKKENSWGIVYQSVRDPDGQCVAILRPPAVSFPRQGKHLAYVWDGTKVSDVYEKNKLIM
ncbi:MAG: RES family NAD+ phosphorylase [Gammaproteobacteria bacterium]|nr:RES family NAD+ phosphorylase [Gammaproteobacteria bacterium]